MFSITVNCVRTSFSLSHQSESNLIYSATLLEPLKHHAEKGEYL